MMKKQLCASALAAMVLLTNGILSNAAELENINVHNSLKEAVTNLERGYSEYYDILSTETILCSTTETDNAVENIYCLTMNVSPKANSVEEIDYYQGIMEYTNTLICETGTQKKEDNNLQVNILLSEQQEIYEELSQYINKEYDLTFYIKEKYDLNQDTKKEILFENGFDYVTWDKMLPLSHETLKNNGYHTMKDLDYECAVAVLNEKSYSYEVSEAVSYMRRYTSNPTRCYACSDSNCVSWADASKYNPNYTNYASTHSDCANYVSQALCEGGIPTDGKWNKNNTTWTRVDQLIPYMTSNGYCTNVSYNVVKRGDIIKFKNISHVAMVTFFDGTTYGYSGHTHDRLDAVIAINSSNTYYRAG